MTTFFYFQNLMWYTDLSKIDENEFMKALEKSNSKKYPEHSTWYNAQYQWYGMDRLKKTKKVPVITSFAKL